MIHTVKAKGVPAATASTSTTSIVVAITNSFAFAHDYLPSVVLHHGCV